MPCFKKRLSGPRRDGCFRGAGWSAADPGGDVRVGGPATLRRIRAADSFFVFPEQDRGAWSRSRPRSRTSTSSVESYSGLKRRVRPCSSVLSHCRSESARQNHRPENRGTIEEVCKLGLNPAPVEAVAAFGAAARVTATQIVSTLRAVAGSPPQLPLRRSPADPRGDAEHDQRPANHKPKAGGEHRVHGNNHTASTDFARKCAKIRTAR